MPAIETVRAREVLDSRGTPTVEVEIRVTGGFGRAAVPSGASTGSHEAVERRDGDPRRFRGKGVRNAVSAVAGELAPAVIGMDAADQRAIDARLCELDGTPNKGRVGANACLAVSLAAARAAAAAQGVPLYAWIATLAGRESAALLPVPMLNVFNGGVHANNGIDLQEFMLVPVGADSFHEALRWGVECAWSLHDALKAQGLNTAVGDEGGVAPRVTGGVHAVLDLLMRAISDAGFSPGVQVCLALDAAANEFQQGDGYLLRGEDHTAYDRAGLVEFYAQLCDRYPIVSIEDGLAEDDWEGWRLLSERLGDRIQLVGDDLFVTNPARLQRGIDAGIANAILIKLNQIGTLTETLDTIALADRAGYRSVISHRSGETEDTTLADLAAGCATGQVKAGAPSRGERTAKYNQLLRIEEALGDDAVYGYPGSRDGMRAPG